MKMGRTEIPNEPSDVKNPSRRRFLRGVAAAGVGATLAKWVSREEKISYEGLKVPGATFYPVYERHDQGPHPDQLIGKPPFHAFSIELYDHSSLSPSGLLVYSLFSEAGYLREHIPQPDERNRALVMLLGRWRQLLHKLAYDRSYLIFPDVRVPYLDGAWYSAFVRNIGYIEAGVSVALSSLIYRKAENAGKDDDSGEKINPPRFSRREFIIGLGKATSFYLASPLGGSLLSIAAVSNHGANEHEIISALRRLAIRLNGMQSGLHPEDASLFVRNLVWAMKFLELERWLNDNFGDLTQNNVNIGFLAGAAHSGVEDFLVLGQDFCADVFGLLPKFYLKELIKANGGVENVSRIRVVSPLTPHDVNDINTFLDEVYKFGMFGTVNPNNLFALNMSGFPSPYATKIKSILEKVES